MLTTIQIRQEIDGCLVELNSDAKLIFCTQKIDGLWMIVSFDSIYEKDTMIPVYPNGSFTVPRSGFYWSDCGYVWQCRNQCRYAACDAGTGSRSARTYIQITTIGFPFLLFSIACADLIRSDGSPTFAMIVSIIGAVINVGLDAFFMFSFGWGIAGAAWATVIG